MNSEVDINGIPWNASWETVCMQYRGRVLTGQFAHYCPDWDYLPIELGDSEFSDLSKSKVAGAVAMTTFQIVGSFYRPPAKAILSVIPIGTPLRLEAEPTNKVDPNAIAIWIETKAIPESAHKALTLEGAGCGFKIGDEPADSADAFLESILMVPDWHLGYIPAIIAKTSEARKLISSGPVSGRFTIQDGKAHIKIIDRNDWVEVDEDYSRRQAERIRDGANK